MTSFWFWFILVGVYGACVGSFLNVVIYRLPAGRSLLHPPSHDPATGSRLKWWENIPILSYLLLRGRSRYTGQWISAQYPLIELTTALLFAGLYAVYYGTRLNDGFGQSALDQTWPGLIVHLTLLGGLIAATVIDTRLYIIPLSITWFVTLVALVVYPLGAELVPRLLVRPMTMIFVAPTVDDRGVGPALGGLVGLAAAVTLLWLKVLPQSFAEQPAGADEPAAAVAVEQGDAQSPGDGRVRRLMTLAAVVLLVVAVVLGSAGLSVGPTWLISAAVLVLWPVLVLVGLAHGPVMAASDVEQEVFAYPHPRREVLKELLFCSLPVLGALLGWLVIGPPASPYPLWLYVLSGVVAGYLVGGAVVWGVRILGTLAFGKEAMGLGDVHLFAAVGAVIGAFDVTVAFFLAPFWGIAAVLLVTALSAVTRARARVIPYGPYLAAGALVMMVFQQPIRAYLTLP